jgi:hypothetical protein
MTPPDRCLIALKTALEPMDRSAMEAALKQCLELGVPADVPVIMIAARRADRMKQVRCFYNKPLSHHHLQKLR